jgi:predicted phage terminase large subunit-like protein
VDGVPYPRLRFNRITPHIGAQWLALCDDRRDVFLGGGGGGGKTRVLLLSMLQFCDVPGYSAMFIRKTFADLIIPGAALDVAHELLDGLPGVTWQARTTSFIFDTGTNTPAALAFGHMSSANAEERYRGAELQAIAIDEISHLPEHQALFMFQRLRRPRNLDGNLEQSVDGLTVADVPLRFRAAANPGGRYVEWVKNRYVMPETRNPGSVHYRFTRADNPSLDSVEYELSLSYLPPAERARMLHGDWTVTDTGRVFDRSWFRHLVDDYPRSGRMVRFWDCAATAQRPGRDSDWTVGVLAAINDGIVTVIDVARGRWSPSEVERNIEHYALTDPAGTETHWEEEGGSAGKLLSAHRRRRYGLQVITKPWPASGSGDKVTRARLAVPAAEAGNVRLLRRPWVTDFLNELHAFDGNPKKHDDQVDAFSGVVRALGADPRFRALSRPTATSQRSTATAIGTADDLSSSDTGDLVPDEPVARVVTRQRLRVPRI